ncbi:MAG: hypothetical protein U0996_07355 [Planctomycetaceae bacterium]
MFQEEDSVSCVPGQPLLSFLNDYLTAEKGISMRLWRQCCIMMLPGLALWSTGCEELGISGSKPPEPVSEPADSLPGGMMSAPPLPDLAPAVTQPKTPDQIVQEIVAMQSIQLSDAELLQLSIAKPANEAVQQLDLGGSRVTAAGMAELAKLPNLRTLKLTGYTGSPSDWAGLAAVTQLETLDASGSNLNDQTLPAVGALVNLKTLNMSRTAVTDAGFTALTKLSKLESIDCGSTSITGAGFEAFTAKYAKSPLRHVYAANTSFGTFGFAHVGNIETLETLAANTSGATDMSIQDLKGLKNLKNLYLAGNGISDAGLQKLWPTLDALEDLDLGGNALVSNFTLEKLLRTKTLKKLRVEGTACNLQGVQDFKKKNAACVVRFMEQEF